MRKNLFQTKKTRRRKIILVVLFVALFAYRKSIYLTLGTFRHEGAWRLAFSQKRFSEATESTTAKTERLLKEHIASLILENEWLKETTQHCSDAFWHSARVQTGRIVETAWRQHELWFRISPNCSGCVAFNAHGLIGRIDAHYGEDLIRPITHTGNLLVGRSLQSKKIYLLQGRGYNRSMEILDADLSDINTPNAGEVIVTAGLDRLYPPNLVIGIVDVQRQTYRVLPAYGTRITPEIYLMRCDNV